MCARPSPPIPCREVGSDLNIPANTAIPWISAKARGSCRSDPFSAGRFGACLRFQTKSMQHIFRFGSELDELQTTTPPLTVPRSRND
jgi:hypothetical protein